MKTKKINLNKWLVFISMSILLLMVAFDQNGLGLMLPSIQEELSLTILQQQWVINIYLLAMASLLMIGGHLADQYTHRKIFIIGVAIFLIASIGCAVAMSALELLFFRALQGVGAALTLPLTFTFINNSVGEGEKIHFMGIFVGTTTVYFIIAPYVCGFITEHFGWRFVFWLNLPLSLLSIACIMAYYPTFISHKNNRGFNNISALFFILTITTFIVALTHGGITGWLTPLVAGLLITSLICGTVFFYIEKTTARPIINLTLFEDKTFSACVIIAFVIQASIILTILTGIYLQTNFEFEPAMAGLLLMLVTFPSIIMPFYNHKIVRFWGEKKSLIIGLSLLAFGPFLIGIATINAFLWLFLLGLFIYSIVVTPILSTIMNIVLSNAKIENQGAVSAITYQARQTGGPFAMAIMGALVYYGVRAPSVMSNIGFAFGMFFSTLLSLIGLIVVIKWLHLKH